jgi:hypothetical protein
VEEREGALGAAWSSAAACPWRGSGPATARAGGTLPLPRDSGGRRGWCDAVDVADRWAGTRRGPGHQRRGEAVGAALIGGIGSTVRPIRFSNQIKLISNGFKFAPNFD